MVTINQLRGETYTGDDPVVKKMYELNARRLDEVLNGVKSGSIVPLFGAGFSADVYPLCKDLLLRLARESSPALEVKTKEKLDGGDFEGAASCIEKEMGKNTFRDDIRETYGEKTLKRSFKGLSSERRNLPRVFNGCILTTNYDRLIERVYEKADLPIESICPHTDYQQPRAEGALQRSGRILFKLHGDAWDPENVILTTGDCEEFYGGKGEPPADKPLIKLMERAFKGRQILFLGSSLDNSRPLDVLRGCCGNVTHYALVELPEETANTGDKTAHVVDKTAHVDDPFFPILVGKDDNQIATYRDKRLNLDELGIRPIWYPHGEHSALDAVLGWLEDEAGTKEQSEDAPVTLPKIPSSKHGVIGRDDEIERILDSLSGDPSIVIVTGPGGIGKTEVCREVLRRLRDSGHAVVYVVTTGLKTAWAQCDAVADALGINRMTSHDESHVEAYAERLLEVLDELERPIVYLDNSEDSWSTAISSGSRDPIALIERLCDGGVSILVSSRVKPTDFTLDYSVVSSVEIDRLSSGKAEELFKKIFNSKKGKLNPCGPDYLTLLANLDGHPLAIVLVATLAAGSSSWEGILDSWPGASLIADDPRHNCLQAALLMSWNAVSDTPMAHELWGVLALTLGNLDEPELVNFARISGKPAKIWRKAFRNLQMASLVSLQGDRISMLRPVREAFLRPPESRLADDATLNTCFELVERRAIDVLNSGDGGLIVTGVGDGHRRALTLLPHALFLLKRALRYRGLGWLETELARALLNYYQYDWALSQPVLRELLEKARLRGDKPIQGLAAQELSECSLYYDELDRASEYIREAMVIHWDLGDHRRYGDDLRNCAELFLKCENWERSERLLHRAIEFYSLKSDYYGLGNAYCSAAEIAISRQCYDEAHLLLEQAERNHVEAGDYLGRANDLHARASLMERREDYSRAEECYALAAKFHEREGDDLGLAADTQSLARLSFQFGELNEAEERLLKAMRLHQSCGDSSGLAEDLTLQREIAIRRGDTETFVRTHGQLRKLYSLIISYSMGEASHGLSEQDYG